jgi:predicted negative regulator of RcsB-dependent stress response
VKRAFTILFLICHSAAFAVPFSPAFGSAQRAMSDGLWDVAALHLRAAAEAPDLPEDRLQDVQILLAQSLIRGNHPDEAIALLEESAVRDHPETPFWLGQALAGKGRFADAAEALSSVAANPDLPFRAEAAITAANLRLSLSQPDAALETLALLENSKDPATIAGSRLHRISILLDLGRIEEARALFPEPETVPENLSRFANLLEGYLLMAEGKAAEAEPLFSALLSDPQGQTLGHYNLAAIGKADSLAAQGNKEAATESLFAFIQSRPATSQLAPMFRRIIAWLPEKIATTDQATLVRLAEWIPVSLPSGSGFINTDANTAAAAWPIATKPLSDLEAFALHARAVAIRRVGTPAAKAEAASLLQRLRLLAPRHFLVPGSLLTLASWKLEDGKGGTAFDMLDSLQFTAKSPLVKGEAAFLKALDAFRKGDDTLAASLFDEAAELLDGENRAAAAFNSALSRLGEDPSAAITIQDVDAEVSEKLAEDLRLERALSADSPGEAKPALDSFLKANPDHPRSPEARLAIAEAALASAPPDLSLARAHLDTLMASGEELPETLAPRLALVRLRLLDLSGADPETIAFANKTIESFPGSSIASEAALILGKTLFHSGNYNEARIALERLAASEPGTQRSQAALLLAARSAALGATVQSREEALAIYDRTIAIDGPLKALAILEKARLFIDLNRLPAAIESLSAAYAATSPDDPARLPTGLLLAEAIYARGDTDPESLSEALEIYDSLLELSAGSPARYFRIQYLRGLTLEKLPKPDDASSTRIAEARQAYFSVIDRPADPPPAEWEWFERSGFRLLSILEAEEDWKAAISIAGKIASFGGPRAKEAATRARQLRLKHMVWED